VSQVLEVALQALLSSLTGAALAFVAFLSFQAGCLIARLAGKGWRQRLLVFAGPALVALFFAAGLGTHTEGRGEDGEVVRDWWPTRREYAATFGSAYGLLLVSLLFGMADERHRSNEAERLQRVSYEAIRGWSKKARRLRRALRRARAALPAKPAD
jgi:hypothetical protein